MKRQARSSGGGDDEDRGLSSLPMELILMILDHIENNVDQLNFLKTLLSPDGSSFVHSRRHFYLKVNEHLENGQSGISTICQENHLEMVSSVISSSLRSRQWGEPLSYKDIISLIHDSTALVHTLLNMTGCEYCKIRLVNIPIFLSSSSSSTLNLPHLCKSCHTNGWTTMLNVRRCCRIGTTEKVSDFVKKNGIRANHQNVFDPFPCYFKGDLIPFLVDPGDSRVVYNG